METRSYWERTLSRRRVLASGVGGTGLLALTVLGCGGSSNSDNESVRERLGNLTKPQDTSKSAKRGGVLNSFVAGDENSLDTLTSSRGAGYGVIGQAYSRLFGFEPAVGIPQSPKIVGELAESWELSKDGLTLTVKLRPDAAFDPRPPTNGRRADADDVVFSLNKFFSQSPYASQLSNKTDPSVPVESIQKVDSRTVVFKMAFPWAPLLSTLARGVYHVQPRESESQIELRQNVRGSGPWMLAEYQPSQFFKWRKNPNWYRKELPYMDGYDLPMISEPAAQLAQFAAKNIDFYGPATFQASDVTALLARYPELKAYENQKTPFVLSMAYGSRPGSPFYDIRVRRAFSRLIDRALYNQTTSEADVYAKANIHLDVDSDSHVSAAFKPQGYWLDPLDASKWGPEGQYWQHNVAEAKALLSAAGHPNGMDVVCNQANTAHGSPALAAIMAQMLGEGGVRVTLNVIDYATVFLPKFWVTGDVKGDFDGFTFGLASAQAHVGTSFYAGNHSRGSFTVARNWDDGQAKIDAMIQGLTREFDENKLRERVLEAQKAMASYMSGVPVSYNKTSVSLAWPWLQNFRVFWNEVYASDAPATNSPPDAQFLHNWIEPSLKT